jgi:inosose dehydratase
MTDLTRRSFVKTSVLGGVSALALGNCGSGTKGPYGGYTMALATYGFRNFTGPEAVAMTKSVGITAMDLWPGLAGRLGGGKADKKIKPYHLNPQVWGEMKQALNQHGVKVLAYGVQRFSADHEANRQIFQWAKDNGIQAFGAQPSPDSFDSLEKLVEEYQIDVGIHNHGANDKLYGKISQVVAAVKDKHPRIGATVDLGHFWRGGEDPVEALEALGDRVLGAHLKDQVGEHEQAILGEGKMDLPGILRTLKKINYQGVLGLEYEDNPDDPLPHIAKCLENLRAMFAEMG